MYFWEIEYPWVKDRLVEFLGTDIFVYEEDSSYQYDVFLDVHRPPCLQIAIIPSQCGGLIINGREEYRNLALKIARFFEYCFIIFNGEIIDVSYE